MMCIHCEYAILEWCVRQWRKNKEKLSRIITIGQHFHCLRNNITKLNCYFTIIIVKPTPQKRIPKCTPKDYCHKFSIRYKRHLTLTNRSRTFIPPNSKSPYFHTIDATRLKICLTGSCEMLPAIARFPASDCNYYFSKVK